VAGFFVSGSKKYIMCRYDPDPFRLRVVRGTNAWADHEAALTELCSNPDATTTETDQCLLDYLQSGYDTMMTTTTTTIMPTNSRKTILNTDDHPESQNVTCPITDDDDDDDECVLVNDLQNLWASDLPIPSSSSTINDTSASATASSSSGSSSSNNNNSNTAKKPWSSRSSPSGTFVRDPTTGRMKNLDL
jgi:hypothetical protein